MRAGVADVGGGDGNREFTADIRHAALKFQGKLRLTPTLRRKMGMG